LTVSAQHGRSHRRENTVPKALLFSREGRRNPAPGWNAAVLIIAGRGFHLFARRFLSAFARFTLG
jgi:hypothetical protein